MIVVVILDDRMVPDRLLEGYDSGQYSFHLTLDILQIICIADSSKQSTRP